MSKEEDLEIVPGILVNLNAGIVYIRLQTFRKWVGGKADLETEQQLLLAAVRSCRHLTQQGRVREYVIQGDK